MICSGKQTVIFKLLTSDDASTVDSILNVLNQRWRDLVAITPTTLSVGPAEAGTQNDFEFEKLSDTDFTYTERLGFKNDLYIIGGGHCALALSELFSRLDFRISIFDDRPELNTIDKNLFAHNIIIVDGYDNISASIPDGPNSFVVVMTLGYTSDEIVIRSLLGRDFKYFGVLGSRSKMATLFKILREEGVPPSDLDPIHTPIGLPINSHTPEEIAISIAAEIISVKNAA
jgi:xanthine dehydrogenase accessory factor